MIYRSLKEIKKDKIIIYHHLGLGDSIICNGLLNYIQNKFEKIYLVANKVFHNQIEFLYSNNNKIQIISDIPVKVNDLDNFVNTFSLENNLDILKIGWLKTRHPFYVNYYKQLKLPYYYSYKFFNYERDLEMESKVYDHFHNYYNTSFQNYTLVHNEASSDKFELKIERKSNIIYLHKEVDIFNNIFYFNKLINNADEIHCINSSYAHLIDRLDSKAKLFYHDIRGSRLKLKKSWKTIKYVN